VGRTSNVNIPQLLGLILEVCHCNVHARGRNYTSTAWEKYRLRLPLTRDIDVEAACESSGQRNVDWLVQWFSVVLGREPSRGEARPYKERDGTQQ
jgi:hypothetical protein